MNQAVIIIMSSQPFTFTPLPFLTSLFFDFRIDDLLDYEGKIPCQYLDRETSIQAVKAFFKGLSTDKQVQCPCFVHSLGLLRPL